MSKNYTKEQEKTLFAAYSEAETETDRDAVVEKYAKEFGKTIPSVRMKLVREGIYVAKQYTSKTGEKPEKKEDIVQDIANIVGTPADVLSGLEKATKNCLKLLREEFRNLNDAVETD